MINEIILNSYQNFTYITAFVLIFLSGLGFPLPEELVLFVLGYLIFLGDMSWWPAILISLAGILSGDITGYFFGLKKGEWLINFIKVKKFLPKNLFYKVEKFFKKRGSWAVFFARFFVGFRFYMSIVAGYFKMPLKKFIFYDALGAILWAPFVIFLSYHVGNLARILTDVKKITHQAYLVVGIIFVIILFINFLWETLSAEKEDNTKI